MAVSGGGEGDGTIAQSVIAAAPGTAQFDGVWLIGEAWGQQAASPNVGLTLDGRGLTVTGPAQGQSNTLPWTWVQRFRPGTPMTFPNGTPATVVEVGLIGRSITLLVPPDAVARGRDRRAQPLRAARRWPCPRLLCPRHLRTLPTSP